MGGVAQSHARQAKGLIGTAGLPLTPGRGFGLDLIHVGLPRLGTQTRARGRRDSASGLRDSRASLLAEALSVGPVEPSDLSLTTKGPARQ